MNPYEEKHNSTNQEHMLTELITQLDEYIVTRVTYEMTYNTAFNHSPTLDLEIDDVIQEIRIKLWHVAQKQVLRSPKAYINRMITTTLIDLLRSREPTLRLFLDEEGEPYEGSPLIDLSNGMDDPSYETAQETSYIELLTKIISNISTFPQQQLRALIHTLRNRIDDLTLLCTMFRHTAGFDIETIPPPSDPTQKRLLQASLHLARKRLYNALKLPSSSSEPYKDGNKPQAESIEESQHKDRSAHAHSTHEHLVDRHTPNKVPPDEEFINRPLIDITQLERLSEPSRTTVRLRYIEHLSYDQIANSLQIPEGTLRSQVSRGMKQLQSPRSQSKALPLQHNASDIEAALTHLHEPYSTVIRLHYLEHLTYPQLAQQLQHPLGTIKSLVSRGNKLMRQYLPSSTATTEPTLEKEIDMRKR